MKYLLLFFLLIILASLIAACSEKSIDPKNKTQNEKWLPVWQDEFNSSAINKRK